MSLRDRQLAFRDEVAQPDDGLPASSPGMAIYRAAYRGRLLAALEVSFARTRQWVGEAAFAAAACHYVLTHPPTGWTLDSYGARFPDLLADLFTDDPEVGELAWVEWHLQQAFAARDCPRLDSAGLAMVARTEADWARVGFTMAAGFALRAVGTHCIALWDDLSHDRPAGEVTRVAGGVAVWREGGLPSYRQLETSELQALAALAGGGTLEDVATGDSAERLGPWLAGWLGEGILSAALLRP